MIPENLSKTLNWEVEERPIYDSTGRALPKFKALHNSSNGKLLHVVGQGYTPTFNSELMENIELLTERTSLELQGFETFRDGAKVMAFLRDTDPRPVAGHRAENYMLIGNSNDYSTAFFTGFTNYVHRCENMFSLRNQQNRISHTRDSRQRIGDLMRAHELYFDAEAGFYRVNEELERVRLRDHHREDMTKHVLDITDLQDVSGRKRNQAESLGRCIDTETAAFGENLLGLFHGATRYVSRELTTKSRTFGNVLGHPAQLNARALEYCRTVAREHSPVSVSMYAPQVAQVAEFVI
jgi:hypothetical protein